MGLPSHNVRLVKPNSAGVYLRHRPETTLLYQIIQEYWPEFQAELASHGKYLPAYVTKEFDEYLKCGRLEHGFLRVRCAKSRHLQVRLAMMKNWLLLVVRDEAFVPVVVHGEWRTVLRCWWMKSCLFSPCVNGC